MELYDYKYGTVQTLLERVKPNEMVLNRYCGLSLSEQQDAERRQELQPEEHDLEQRGMPCITSGQAVCFLPSAAVTDDEDAWWHRTFGISFKHSTLAMDARDARDAKDARDARDDG